MTAPALNEAALGFAEINSSGASRNPAGTLMRCASLLKVNLSSLIPFNGSNDGGLCREPRRDRACDFADGDVHTLPVPATPAVTVVATPEVAAYGDVAFVERAIALGRG